MLVRSTNTPAQADSSRIGRYWQATSRPRATPLPVRWRMRRVRATLVSQLPVCEMVWPTKNRRKFRQRSDETVRVMKLGLRAGASSTGSGPFIHRGPAQRS